MVAKNLQEKIGEVIKGQVSIQQVESNSSRNQSQMMDEAKKIRYICRCTENKENSK